MSKRLSCPETLKRFSEILVGLTILSTVSTAIADAQSESTPKPKIAIFSGPTATIQNSEPLITSSKAREQHGLPPLTAPDGSPMAYDALRPQRLAAPVTVYIEAYSAHPLESDAAELYAPPDGFITPATGEFHEQRRGPDDIPVYEATLEPEDGLYMLPYMAMQASGEPWDGNCATSGTSADDCRVTFYPDASRIVEQIDRFGLGAGGTNNLLSTKAEFDFYRPAPSGGYRKGLPASERTDVGEGDIPPEVLGEDFFTYGAYGQGPAMPTLAELTNVVHRAMSSGEYAGAVWLEGSPTTEETTYWLGLLIDTTVPIVGNSSQRVHGMLSNDGDRNIVDAVDYILSGVWRDAEGLDRVGAVMLQEEQIFTARDVQKEDDRPGGYVATGAHGGIIGSTLPMTLTFLPTKKHTHTSDVNLTRLPSEVQGVQREGDAVTAVPVAIKNDQGGLRPAAIPKVEIVKHARYASESTSDDPASEADILALIDKNLRDFPLSGFVLEGSAPYGSGDEPTMAALSQAALHGMPVARVGRGNAGGVTATNPDDLFVEGLNLTSTKARLLLMASIMKFGSLPLPADPENPTEAETDAIKEKLAEYQTVFDTH